MENKAKSVILAKIISTLISLSEEKLSMIYQVIKIITNLNGKDKHSDISSILDLEVNTTQSDKVRRVDDLSSLRKSNNSNDSNSIQPRSINSYDSVQGKLIVIVDKKFIIPKKRHRDDDKKTVHIKKRYEMSDKHSLISEELNNYTVEHSFNDKLRTYKPTVAVNNKNNIAPIQKNKNVYKPVNPLSNHLLLNYSGMSSNSDIDPLLVTSDMEKKFYVKVPKYEHMKTPSSYSQSNNQVFFPYPLINDDNMSKSTYTANSYNQFIKPQIQATQYFSPNFIGYDVPPSNQYVYTPGHTNYPPSSPYMNFKQPSSNKYPDQISNIKLPITDKKFIKYTKK
jgi:hypothetical protein